MVGGISVLDDEIDPSQVIGLVCWRLLGRYDPAFAGEEAVAEEMLPQASCQRRVKTGLSMSDMATLGLLHKQERISSLCCVN